MRLKFVKLLAIIVCVFTIFMVVLGFGCSCIRQVPMDKYRQEKVQNAKNCRQQKENNAESIENATSEDKTLKVNGNFKVELLCLMYHNVVAENERENDYEVNWRRIENDFIELKELGYSCVSCAELEEIVKEQRGGRYVMITFDDGFYGVYKYIPPLLEKYDMKCVVAVVGEFMDMADKASKKTRCSYMNSREVQAIAQNTRVEVAHHTYYMHHHTKQSKGAKIRQGESREDYFARLEKDTNLMQKRLAKLGVYSQIFCYPYGDYCSESEQFLREKGFKITMTCVEKKTF